MDLKGRSVGSVIRVLYAKVSSANFNQIKFKCLSKKSISVEKLVKLKSEKYKLKCSLVRLVDKLNVRQNTKEEELGNCNFNCRM